MTCYMTCYIHLHTLQGKMVLEFGIHLFAKTFAYNHLPKRIGLIGLSWYQWSPSEWPLWYTKVAKGPGHDVRLDVRQYFGSTAHPSKPMLDAASQDVLRVSRLHRDCSSINPCSALSKEILRKELAVVQERILHETRTSDQCFPLHHVWPGFQLQEHLTWLHR